MRALVLVTTAFSKMASLERAALGRPDLELLVMEHPLLGRDEEVLTRFAESFRPVFDRRFGGSAE